VTKKQWYKKTFFNFLTYNVFFLLLQLVIVIQSQSGFARSLKIPASVYPVLLGALVLQIILCLILTWVQTGLLWGVKTYPLTNISEDRWVLTIIGLSLVAIIGLNCHFFPLSVFSLPFVMALPSFLIDGLLISSLMLMFLLSIVTLWCLIQRHPLIITGVFVSGFIFVGLPKSTKPIRYPTHKEPNLIMIGVDSLSPEFVNLHLTPNLSQFLNKSVHFQQTISPLARTSSAWVSMLTGLYALHHGERENLYPRENIKYDSSLAWTLQKNGYRTIFATDDRRFNNLGNEMGFEEIIGPNIGIGDVLLGTFYDFPLSNFLINTKLGHWLLPYNYINRAGHFSYYPSTFDKAVQASLNHSRDTRPLFLAVHFTLPHWPYAWATSSPDQAMNMFDFKNKEDLYFKAIQQADKQVGKLLNKITNLGLLSNSMVIVLSDHGETLYKKGTRKTTMAGYQGKNPSQFVDYLARKTDTELEMSGGHGSDLLSPSQFKCLLGIKIFKHGQMTTIPQSISTSVALIDIAPTIADFLNIQLKERPDGMSLLSTLINHTEPPNHRSFMMESGLLPNTVLNKEMMIFYAKLLFDINPNNNLLQIRKEQIANINALKLYGLIRDEWLLALYPDDDRYVSVLLNLKNGKWSDEPDSEFIKSTPFNAMLSELRLFYRDDLSTYPLSKLNMVSLINPNKSA
jgi:arylsulfatase A-like enzyme